MAGSVNQTTHAWESRSSVGRTDTEVVASESSCLHLCHQVDVSSGDRRCLQGAYGALGGCQYRRLDTKLFFFCLFSTRMRPIRSWRDDSIPSRDCYAPHLRMPRGRPKEKRLSELLSLEQLQRSQKTLYSAVVNVAGWDTTAPLAERSCNSQLVACRYLPVLSRLLNKICVVGMFFWWVAFQRFAVYLLIACDRSIPW